MQKLLISTIVCATLLFAGCSIHKPDIQQGNVLEAEMLDRLKVGMTKRQVRFIMGSPSIEDPFRKDRWDYFYSLTTPHQPTETEHVIIYFSGDEVSKIVKK